VVLARLEGVKRNGTGIMARCPAHDDREPSLSIAEGDDGRVLLTCHAGCPTRDIVARLGLGMADLFPARPLNGHGLGQPIATYPYTDADGRLLFEVLRYHPKTFRQRRPDGQGGWLWKLG